MRAVVAMCLVAAACSAERAREGGGGGSDGTVHGPGILDPTSADWHGKALAGVGWDVAVCETCHDGSKPGGPPTAWTGLPRRFSATS